MSSVQVGRAQVGRVHRRAPGPARSSVQFVSWHHYSCPGRALRPWCAARDRLRGRGSWRGSTPPSPDNSHLSPSARAASTPSSAELGCRETHLCAHRHPEKSSNCFSNSMTARLQAGAGGGYADPKKVSQGLTGHKGDGAWAGRQHWAAWGSGRSWVCRSA